MPRLDGAERPRRHLDPPPARARPRRRRGRRLAEEAVIAPDVRRPRRHPGPGLHRLERSPLRRLPVRDARPRCARVARVARRAAPPIAPVAPARAASHGRLQVALSPHRARRARRSRRRARRRSRRRRKPAWRRAARRSATRPGELAARRPDDRLDVLVMIYARDAGRARRADRRAARARSSPPARRVRADELGWPMRPSASTSASPTACRSRSCPGLHGAPRPGEDADRRRRDPARLPERVRRAAGEPACGTTSISARTARYLVFRKLAPGRRRVLELDRRPGAQARRRRPRRGGADRAGSPRSWWAAGAAARRSC